MATFNAIEISEILGTDKSFIRCPQNSIINRFAVDSRSVTSPASTLFFSIQTANNDGHRFIAELYSRGVRNFIVNRIPDNMPEANFYQVTDSIEALQKLASTWRNNFKFPVIAITGSRGKTEVKEWLYAMLKHTGLNGQRSPRSYNSQIGVALSLLSFENKGEFAIVEAGISKQGEMKRIEAMVKPEIGILTNITPEHDEGFSSRKDKIREKLRLFSDSEKVVYYRNDNDIELNDIIDETIDRYNQFAWIQIPDIVRKMIPDGSSHDLINAETTLTAAKIIAPDKNLFDIKLERIATRIDVEKGLNNCIILHDRFTNDIESLYGALDFASRRVTPNRSLSLIIDSSDFNNEFNDTTLRGIAEDYDIKRIIATDDIDRFKKDFSPESFVNEIILVKGKPSSRFEQIVSMLEAKQHETVLEVNLDNLVHNFNFFKSKLPSSTGVIVMLKADGYGCGALELAKTLQSQGAAAIAVAVVDEGVELRKSGITMPIIVLNPRARNSEIMIENKLEPEVYNFELLHNIIKNVEAQHTFGFPIHIKLDTGMHRLGFSRKNLPELINILNSTNSVIASTVFSHLATADCLDMDDYTEYQLNYFSDCVKYLQSNLNNSIKAHILNTAGILRYPQYHYDFVRLGIGLYGLPVINTGIEDPLRPVASLYSTIISITNRHTGDTIGYGRRGKVSGDKTIATIPIGYADGIDRHLGNGKAIFMVNGHECPTIGNICMDICMIDVTGANAKVGDRVEIFGPETDVCRLSDILETIPYEILTSISPRVKRVYYRE